MSDAPSGAGVADLLERSLRQAFDPLELVIRDDSHLHAGHAGAREGGHFAVVLRSAKFQGLSRVARHRLVYHAISPLMKGRIHALAIEARAPEEP
ncbi:MAG: hypothetical protein RI949_22 [Pseudomonadota bacterium]|jgi:BolA protein